MLKVKCRTWAVLFLGCLAVIVPSEWAQSTKPETGPEFTIFTSSELVVLNVGVQDRRGANVAGLTEDVFKVYEDGKLQTIKQFSAEERPVTIGIVVDASGSMRSKQNEVTTASLSFVQASNPEDEVFVVNFNDGATLGLPAPVPFSRDLHLLGAALLGTRPEGRTALYDAISLAAKHLAKAKWENKALLLISDGGDNNSVRTFVDAIGAVQKSGAAVYAIGLFDPEGSDQNPSVLRRLTNLSGGEMFKPSNITDVSALCVRAAEDIRAGYTLAYTPPNPDQHKAPRKLKVVAQRSNGGRLTVRTRASYVLGEN